MYLKNLKAILPILIFSFKRTFYHNKPQVLGENEYGIPKDIDIAEKFKENYNKNLTISSVLSNDRKLFNDTIVAKIKGNEQLGYVEFLVLIEFQNDKIKYLPLLEEEILMKLMSEQQKQATISGNGWLRV